MIEKTFRRILTLVMCLNAVAATCRAADATGELVKSGKWSETATWQDGVIPDGAGAVLDTGAGCFGIIDLGQVRTLGGIVTDASKLPSMSVSADARWFTLSNVEIGRYPPDAVAPSKNGWRWLASTNALVFDNGTSPAFITIGSPDGATEPFRHLFRVPVVLKSDLAITHAFPGAGTYSGHTHPAYAISFSNPISEEGGRHGMTVDMGGSSVGLALREDNTFSGDLRLTRGLLRAYSLAPVAGVVRTPFGVSNRIYAVTGDASVDLGGMTTGEGQELHLAGTCSDAASTRGALLNLWGEKEAFAEWRGGIVLEGDASIGGSMGVIDKPWKEPLGPGNMLLSGNISETTPSALTLRGDRIVLSGTNTFSGGITLASGSLTARCPEAFGTGGLTFAGGTYRYERATDADPFAAVEATGTTHARIDVADGVNLTPRCIGTAEAPLYGLIKTGGGTLTVTNQMKFAAHFRSSFYGGEVVFDDRESYQSSWSPYCVYLYNDTRFVFRNTNAVLRAHSIYAHAEDGAAVTYRADGNVSIDATIETVGNKAVVFYEETNGGRFRNVNVNAKTGYVGPNRFYGEDLLAADGSNDKHPAPFTGYAHDWTSGGFVDVTPELAKTPIPDGTVLNGLRFNTTDGSDEIVLTLAGMVKCNDSCGMTVLVGSGMGKTKVRITGGTISNTVLAASLRFVNFNTNAALTVESELAGESTHTSTAKSYTTIAGRGVTALRGANTTDGIVYVLNGATLDVDSADRFGLGGGEARQLYFSGGTLRAHGTFNMVWDRPDSYFTLNVDHPGMVIDVPDANDTLTFHNADFNYGSCVLNRDAKLVKRGAGRFLTAHPTMGDLVVEEGSIASRNDQYAFSCNGARGNLRVGNGVTLPGTVANPDLRSYEHGARTLTVGAGGATVDVQNASLVWRTSVNYHFRSSSYFRGTNTLTFISSTGGYNLKTRDYRNENFAGTMNMLIDLDGENGGIWMPKCEWRQGAGTCFNIQSLAACDLETHFGALTGDGYVKAKGASRYMPAYVYVGRDADETKYFDGTLDFTDDIGGRPFGDGYGDVCGRGRRGCVVVAGLRLRGQDPVADRHHGDGRFRRNAYADGAAGFSEGLEAARPAAVARSRQRPALRHHPPLRIALEAVAKPMQFGRGECPARPQSRVPRDRATIYLLSPLSSLRFMV